jgi:uncharacterized membrane protein (UPF0136 family)
MKLAQVVLVLYGALMLLGGFLGYRMAKSTASLIAGAASGVVLLVAFGWSLADPRAGAWIGVCVSVLLTLVFFLRVRKTKKVMPSGVLLGLSIAALALLVYAVVRPDR